MSILLPLVHVMPEIGHVTIMLKAEEIILALVQKKAIAA
jgi:hypothetical protein